VTYSKKTFSKDLEALLNNQASCHQISKWAYETRLNNLRVLDEEIGDVLNQLGMMEMGPEYEFTKDELWSLARKYILNS